MKIREIIDRDPDRYKEPLDSGKKLFHCPHTQLFLRTLGYFNVEKGDFLAAKTLYENRYKNFDNLFEKVCASNHLVNIYSQLARQEWDTKKRDHYYLEAYLKALLR